MCRVSRVVLTRVALFQPNVVVSPQSLDFARCVPLVRRTASIQVRNIGASDAHVSVAVLEAPWLQVLPRVCVVEPNETKEFSVSGGLCLCAPACLLQKRVVLPTLLV